MRIHRLELQAFGPFAAREEVGFTVLNDAGLFLLDGPTGAGKSTVLAGICFALYGSVPGDRSPESLASTQAPLGSRPEVLLDFTVGGRRFEIQRWPRYRRPARRKLRDGSALTEEKAGAVLREHREGQWREVSVRADEIGHQLQQVLHLDADQFMRVVLLPQGEFATFLRAKSSEKETLLRKLFGTGRFDGVEEFLAGRHRQLETAVSRDRDQVAAARTDLVSCLADALGDQWWACTATGNPADGEAADGAAADLPAVDLPAVDLPATDPVVDDAVAVAEPQDALGVDPSGGPGSGPPTAPVTGPADWSDEDLTVRGTAAIDEAVDGSRAARKQAVEALSTAQAQLEEMTCRQQDLRQAAAWQDRSTRHRHTAGRISGDRQALDRHRAAVSVDRRAREAETAGAARRAALAGLEQARAAALADEHCRSWIQGQAETPGAEARFNAALRRADRELDRVAGLERDAERLRSLAEEAERLEESRCTLNRRAEAAEAERETLGGVHADLQRRIEDLTVPAAGVEAARATVAEAEARSAASLEHRRHRTALDTAEDQLRAATDRAQQAVDAWHEVVERRLAGAASLLAAGLRPETPCQVCGSVEHPAPAATGGAEISAETQKMARRTMDEQSGNRRAAAEAVDRARAEADRSRLESGGLEPEQAAAALEEARTVREAAEGAARELAGARTALARNERDQVERAGTVASVRQETAVARSRLEAATEEAERLREDLTEALEGRDGLAGLRQELTLAHALVTTVVEAERQSAGCESAARQAETGLAEELDISDFDSVQDVRAALLQEQDERSRTARVRDWDREAAALTELEAGDAVARGRSLLADGAVAPTDEEISGQEGLVAAAAVARDDAAERAGGLESVQRQVRRQVGVLDEVTGRSAGQLTALHEVEGLLRLVRGQGENALKMTLGSYVLAGRLEEVVASATERLLGMTQGRYELRHDDAARGRGVRGLDITVFDRYTEDERTAGTLSGGETFMASLALALGLADTVQAEAGGVDMDTLFVDEGFGSLDSASLQDVMEVLDGLQADGRTIGVVSHVERMRQDIGYRLEVHKTRQGSHLEVVVPERA